MPHRSGTTVIQVWHAVGALKRFGWDTRRPLADPERRFLHRHYDWVVCSAEPARVPYAAAFRVPLERVVALGSPRVDAFADPAALAAARERVLARYPVLRDRRVVLYAPTFRGRGAGKSAAPGLDGPGLRAGLPADHVLVLKTHPNLDPRTTPTAGFDLVAEPLDELNDLLAATDVLVTDYSSSIFEWSLLHRPLVLLVPDLAAYEQDPGLYLDYRTDMIGTQVVDTAGVIAAVLAARTDVAAEDAFATRHLGPHDGRASDRFVERFLGPARGGRPASEGRGDTLPRDVRHE
jgi:CDP-ribitol ribitolphosphotransferase